MSYDRSNEDYDARATSEAAAGYGPYSAASLRGTPRTNEVQFGTGRVSVDFARQLERENTELLARLHARTEAVIESGRRDALRIAELERLLAESKNGK